MTGGEPTLSIRIPFNRKAVPAVRILLNGKPITKREWLIYLEGVTDGIKFERIDHQPEKLNALRALNP